MIRRLFVALAMCGLMVAADPLPPVVRTFVPADMCPTGWAVAVRENWFQCLPPPEDVAAAFVRYLQLLGGER